MAHDNCRRAVHPNAPRCGDCPDCVRAHGAQRDEDETIAARQFTHGRSGKSRATGKINGQRYGKRLAMPQPGRVA